MTTNEKQFVKESILKVVLNNEDGLSIDVILEYLDYINKVAYHKDNIIDILQELVNENIISKKNGKFISINNPTDY